MLQGMTVRDAAEARLDLCVGADQSVRDSWVVYLPPANGMHRLSSSNVVLLCKRTGRVLYEGSANDEG